MNWSFSFIIQHFGQYIINSSKLFVRDKKNWEQTDSNSMCLPFLFDFLASAVSQGNL